MRCCLCVPDVDDLVIGWHGTAVGTSSCRLTCVVKCVCGTVRLRRYLNTRLQMINVRGIAGCA